MLFGRTALNGWFFCYDYRMKNLYIIIAVVLVALALWSLWGYFSSRVEQADYVVVKSGSGYEIRRYPAHLVAQARVKGTYQNALNEGFRIVAGYIFGGNVSKQSVAMTAPVVAEPTRARENASGASIAMTAPVVASPTAEGEYTISFGMPRSYTRATLPTPTDSRVSIVEIPERTFAVLRYSGYSSTARVKEKGDALLALLVRDQVKSKGTVSYAGYNAPWTPPWFTRHEVLVEVDPALAVHP